jgi:hypothetical protein
MLKVLEVRILDLKDILFYIIYTLFSYDESFFGLSENKFRFEVHIKWGLYCTYTNRNYIRQTSLSVYIKLPNFIGVQNLLSSYGDETCRLTNKKKRGQKYDINYQMFNLTRTNKLIQDSCRGLLDYDAL